MSKDNWEVVPIKGDKNSAVRRLAVPGGWLYQVERFERREAVNADTSDVFVSGWSDPVFVPDC